MKNFLFILVFLASYSSDLLSYRFVCNGILADGTTRGDSCGPCTEKTAARWHNPNVPVIVDFDTLPAGISKSDWREIIQKSFAAWNNVSGINFRFMALDAKSRREFGSNNAFHEIYWITNAEEWRRVVGTGEIGTFGATMPVYTCGSGPDDMRIIHGADMVINGLKHINWKKDCTDDDCISPQTTVVHELGHFAGLDHPCLLCSTSIMSARAGYDLKNPKLDDMEGLRVLYPSEQSMSGFGSSCTKDEDCSSNANICIEDKSNFYCTVSCLKDEDCDQGAICQLRQEKSVCTFIDQGNKEEGENCSRVPCVDPLVCAGSSMEESFCFAPCQNDEQCAFKQQCIALKDDNVSICVTIQQKGDLCFDSQLCDEHLYCIFDTPDTGVCREKCGIENADTTGCPEGEVCEIIEGRFEICLPASGQLSLGENTDGFSPERSFLGREKIDAPRSSSCRSVFLNTSDFSIIVLATLLLAWRQRKRIML